jgi:NAD(P)-dependent dehydrogenase (short-subunit alcohol dehydrogenase family)
MISPSLSLGCILVSDTSTPLGKESAIYLASKGFTVFCGVEQLHAISQMRSKLSQSHNQRLLVPILLPDLCNQELLQNALQSILHHMETLDTADRFLIGIVNTSNARLNQMKPLEDVSVADWNGILSSNLVGPFSVISKFLPLLRISCGRIVNVSSFTSLTSSPMNGVFSCSKNVRFTFLWLDSMCCYYFFSIQVLTLFLLGIGKCNRYSSE